IAKSCWAACDHDHEDPSIALDAYLEHFLPMARHLATMIPDHMPPGQAAALKEAGKLLLRPHAMKSQGIVPSNPNLALEGLLWRAAFSRLDARAKNGPGRLFPAAMHGARI